MTAPQGMCPRSVLSRTDPSVPCFSPQSVENAVCVLRNLSYRLYDEMPPSSLQRLEGHRRNNGGTMTGELVGCFSPQSKKAREVSGRERVILGRGWPFLCRASRISRGREAAGGCDDSGAEVDAGLGCWVGQAGELSSG